jgi:hypothetical protein
MLLADARVRRGRAPPGRAAGEIRNWLVVGGAMGDRPAVTADYNPAHHAATGLGFAYWPCDDAAGGRRRAGSLS